MASAEAIELFVAWLNDNGARFPKIDWPCNTPTGRGAVATADISTNEPILEIPFTLMMSPLHAFDDPIIGTILSKYQSELECDILLSIYIMYEKLKGIESFYFPYLNILPSPGSITSWTRAQVDLCQDPGLSAHCNYRIHELKQLYSQVTLITSLYSAIFPPELYTYDAFLFAYGAVQSRAFGRRLPWSALVPFADCLNHTNVQTKYDFDVNQNGTFRLYPSGANFYSSGAEVFNSYGRRPNDNLLLGKALILQPQLYIVSHSGALLDYGFCLLDNEWDIVSMTTVLKNTEEEYAMKTRLLHSIRVATTMKSPISRFGLPLDIITFYRVLAMSKAELEVLGVDQARYKDVAFSNLETELRAITLLLAALIRLAKQYPTSLEEDEETLQSLASVEGVDKDESLHTALVYRVTQKRIVRVTYKKLHYLKHLLSRLVDGERLDTSLEQVLNDIVALSGGEQSRSGSGRLHKRMNGASRAELGDYLRNFLQ